MIVGFEREGFGCWVLGFGRNILATKEPQPRWKRHPFSRFLSGEKIQRTAGTAARTKKKIVIFVG
jgi:hypothetical protein